MEIPHAIKQEKVDYFSTEPDVKFETDILDSMEIKLDPIKIEPNLDQKINLNEETKLIENNDKSLFNCSPLIAEKQEQIKLKASDSMTTLEELDVYKDFKIKNEEIIIKEEEVTLIKMESPSTRMLNLVELPEDETTKGLQEDLTENAIGLTKEQSVFMEKTSSEHPNLTNSVNGNGIAPDASADRPQLLSSIKNKDQIEKPSSSNSQIIFRQDSVIAASKEKGKLVRNKGYSCYFCQRIVRNAARHFELLHSHESEVAKLLAKPKNSKERRYGFGNLIRVGNFYHNTEVLATKRGNLILVRRPTEYESKFVTPADYGPCPYCLGFMLKKHLWHHLKNSCTAKPPKDDQNHSRHVIAESHALLNEAFGKDFSTDYVTNILSKLRDDDVGAYCKEDPLIQRFGAMLFEKYGTTQYELTRQSMRQLARLTLKLREIDKSRKQLTDFLLPEKFDLIIQATKSLCVSHQTTEFELPSLALKIRYALKKCAGIKRGGCLRAGNLSGNESLLCFLNLIDLEWSTRVSSNALATIYNRTISAAQLLSLTGDLIKLSNYLNREMAKKQIALTECPTEWTWSRLAFLTLSKIILFNKKRSGEAARMTTVAYSSRPKSSDLSAEELKQFLTDFEKKLADRLTLVEIVDKRGRKVPILLTQDVKSSVDKLIQTKADLNISINNPFIFARTGDSLLSMRGYDCLRIACVNAGLENPDRITSTELQKYTTTVCQVLSLSENDYDWLARHLGHDIGIHREVYRLQENAVELTKVSRLLLAVDKGQVNKFAGMSLDEINLDDILTETLHSDDDDDEKTIQTQENLEKKEKVNQSEQSVFMEETSSENPNLTNSDNGNRIAPDAPAGRSQLLPSIKNEDQIEKFSSSNSQGIFRQNSVIAASKEKGKLVRNKEYSCYFCQRIVRNAARHFELLHSNESEVAKLLTKPKKSKERKNGFGNLIRVGNFYHNTEVLATKRGNLILVRRPTENESKFVTSADYGPCPYCLGFMLKKHLWHHVKNSCTAKPPKDDLSHSRHVIAESHALLNEAFGRDFSTDYVTNILSKLRDDDVGAYCKEDPLIQRFGAMLFEKYGTTQYEPTRQSMRQLARLTLKLREIDKSRKQLTDFLLPEKFDLIIQATKSLCVTHQTTEFELPSLALKIGYALKKCAGIKRGGCLRAGNLSGNESLLCFLNLVNLELSTRVSSNALATIYNRTISAAQLLSLTGDLIKLSSYLNREMVKEQIALAECPTAWTWSRLAFLTLGKIILFNKKRSGEAARMTIVAYSSRPKSSDLSAEELKQFLTDFEKKLADRLTLVEIVDKRGRKVPILLTQDVQSSVDKLIQTRADLNISIKNPFIFARTGDSILSMRGHDCLRRACLNAGLENPDRITSTELQKYTTTVCQVLSLSENDYDWLARHLGHDIGIHREVYRLQENAVELTKVSRLLLAVDKGQVNKFAGMSLDEINLDDISTETLRSDDDDDKKTIRAQENLEKREEVNQSEYSGAIKKPRITRALEKSSPVVQVAPREAVAKSKTYDRRAWSVEEKGAVLNFFKSSIKRGVLPGKEDCIKCIEESNGILALRSWTHVKFCMKNHLGNLKKRKSKIS